MNGRSHAHDATQSFWFLQDYLKLSSRLFFQVHFSSILYYVLHRPIYVTTSQICEWKLQQIHTSYRHPYSQPMMSVCMKGQFQTPMATDSSTYKQHFPARTKCCLYPARTKCCLYPDCRFHFLFIWPIQAIAILVSNIREESTHYHCNNVELSTFHNRENNSKSVSTAITSQQK